MARTKNTQPIRLLEVELEERFGNDHPVTRIVNTRTRRAGSYKHRDRRRSNHADRRATKNALRNGDQPLATLRRNSVRWDMM